jgi:hypothetical protein
MFNKKSLKVVRNNAFKAALVGFGGVALVMSLSACSPVSSLKSAYEGQPFPQMPAPEVATYVLDLSGSTNPAAQLDALGSGINDFVAGQSLGNPFAQTPVAPRGLSIQFVTQNSAQAPRILLVSATAGASLYSFVKDKTPNLEGARQLWDGLMNARTQIWQNSALEANSAECVNQVIKMLGRQQLLPAALREPSNMICQDAKQSNAALKSLKDFVTNPSIQMGSDVEGAVLLSLKNLEAAKGELPSAHLTLVIASDLVDEVSLSLPHRLAGSDSKTTCALAHKDANAQGAKFNDVKVVIVGARNSKYAPKLLDQVHSYWSCYFAQIGITNIQEQSDLSGF